jgi:hypothetical protein
MNEKDTQIALTSSKCSTLARRSAEALAKRGLDDLLLLKDANKHSCLAAVSTTDGWGFIDQSGSFVIEPRYSWAASYSNQRACFSRSDWAYHWAFISYSYLYCMRDVDHLRFEFLYGQTPDPSKPRDVFGYLDPSGEEVIPPQFCCAEPFRQGVARVALKAGRGVGFIGIDGAFEIEPQFDEATNFEDGLAVVSQNEKYGVLGRTGNLVVTPCFDYVWNFSEGLARFRVGEKVGFIDLAGKIAIEPRFDCALEFAEGLAPVQIDGSWGFITKEGHFSIEPAFYSASSFSAGAAEVEDWETAGPYRIDRTGARVPYVDTKEDPAFEKGSHLERAYRAGLWGFENESGKSVIPAIFQSAGEFSNGLARVANEGGLWGYINSEGEIVIPLQFLDCRDFVLLDQAIT